jgi:hypothetical protein
LSCCEHLAISIATNRPDFPSGVRNYDFNLEEYERYKSYFLAHILPHVGLSEDFDLRAVKIDYNFMFLSAFKVNPEAAFSKEEIEALKISKAYEKKTVSYLGLSGKAIFFLIACAISLASGAAYYNGVKPVEGLSLEQATLLVIVSSLVLTYLNSYAGLWITGILPDTVSKYENKEQNAIDEILLKKSKSCARVLLHWYSPTSTAQSRKLALFFSQKIDFTDVYKKLAPSSTQADKILTALDPVKEVCKIIQLAEAHIEPANLTDWVVIAKGMGITFAPPLADEAV